jgi:hypothetical protein
VRNIIPTKKYVGTANTAPDSLTPRRFTIMIKITNVTANPTRCPRSHGKAEAIWATPEETDTATVRM